MPAKATSLEQHHQDQHNFHLHQQPTNTRYSFIIDLHYLWHEYNFSHIFRCNLSLISPFIYSFIYSYFLTSSVFPFPIYSRENRVDRNSQFSQDSISNHSLYLLFIFFEDEKMPKVFRERKNIFFEKLNVKENKAFYSSRSTGRGEDVANIWPKSWVDCTRMEIPTESSQLPTRYLLLVSRLQQVLHRQSDHTEM